MQNKQKNDVEEMPNAERDDLNVKQVADEATNQSTDETLRQFLRGDETRGDADERDVVGGSDSIDTPQGREEAKQDKGRDS